MVQKDETRPGPSGRGLNGVSSGDEHLKHSADADRDQLGDLDFDDQDLDDQVADGGSAETDAQSDEAHWDTTESYDSTQAADFILSLPPGDRYVCFAYIDVRTKRKGSFECVPITSRATLIADIERRQGKANCYYGFNPLINQPVDAKGRPKKAGRADIKEVVGFHVDLDPRTGESQDDALKRIVEQLESYPIRPSIVIASGGGVQAVWLLEAPIEINGDLDKAEEVKLYNMQLEHELGGDTCHNIDRMLRIPYTVNLADEKKIKKGRHDAVAFVVWNEDTRYPISRFTKAQPKRPGSADAGSAAGGAKAEAWQTVDVDALPVSTRIKNLIRGIDDPQHQYPSRSERVMAVLVAMVGAGCTDEQMAAVMLAESLPIGQHVREQSNSDRYLTRQIAEARKAATDPDVARLNENYALVMVGDGAAIMKTAADGIKFMTVWGFELWLANRFVERGDKTIPLAKHWKAHPQRRQYDGVVFAPNREVPHHFNLWRGFAAEPRAGDCSKFLAHLRDNVCRGDESLYYWVVGWFAQIVQQPDKKMGTALVFRGKEGTGKTKVGEVIGSLLGNHYVPVSDPRYITGRFNSHLASCLLLHCDEAFWAGDHAAEGKLKDLITGHDHLIEYKGREPIRVRNYLRLLIIGNPDWLVPAGFEERRFAVLDIGEDHIQDSVYFAAIDEELNNGGREALLDFLLRFDLKTVNLRAIPKTAALLDQKIASLTAEQGWWLDVLARGELPWGCPATGACPTERLFDRYINHAGKVGAKRRAIETQLGIFLAKQVPGLRKIEGQYLVFSRAQNNLVPEVGRLYQFPSLRECRQAFARALQQEFRWDERRDWVHEPRSAGGYERGPI
jgi:hypothetical protein